MKRVLSLTLCLLSVLAIGTDALAAEYGTTQVFLTALEEEADMLSDYQYTGYTYGLDDNGNEHVYLTFEVEGVPEMNVTVLFNETGTVCSMQLFSYIQTNQADRVEVLDMLNGLNNSYRYVRWYIDDYNEVCLQIDPIFRDSADCGSALVEYLLMMVRVAEAGYPMLEAYAA